MTESRLDRLVEDVAEIKAAARQDAQNSAHYRDVTSSDIRSIKDTLSSMTVQITNVAVLSSEVSQIRDRHHGHNNELQRIVGVLAKEDSALGARLDRLEAWRLKTSLIGGINKSWWAWLIGLFSSVGTLILTELANWWFKK